MVTVLESRLRLINTRRLVLKKTVFLRGRVRSKRQLNTISHRRQTYHINLVDQTHIEINQVHLSEVSNCIIYSTF